MPVFMNTLEMEPQEEGKTMATIRVRHANMTPESVYLTRARMQALTAVGVIRSVEAGFRDLTESEFERLTEVRGVGGVSKGHFSSVDDVMVAVKVPPQQR